MLDYFLAKYSLSGVSTRKIKSRLAGTFFIIVLFSLIYCGCGQSPISNKEKDAFIKTYVELTLVQAEYGNAPKRYEAIAQNVYKNNGTSKESMNSTLVKISRNSQTEKEIFEEISKRLKTYQKAPADTLEAFFKNLTSEI